MGYLFAFNKVCYEYSKCGTSAYFTFSRELRSPLEVHHDLKAIVEVENFVPQITPHLLKLANTLKLAMEMQEKQQDKNKSFVDRKRRPQPTFNIGDKVLATTHVLSNASEGVTSKFATRRDGPYPIIAKKGATCYVIASLDNTDNPIATHHAADLTPYKGKDAEPSYPRRKRGRPRENRLVSLCNVAATSNENGTQHNNNTTTSEGHYAQGRYIECCLLHRDDFCVRGEAVTALIIMCIIYSYFVYIIYFVLLVHFHFVSFIYLCI